MHSRHRLGAVLAAIILPFSAVIAEEPAPKSVTVASYNVENYLSMDRYAGETRITGQPKPEEEKDAVVQVIAEIKPDILGIVEIGQKSDLADLQERLKKSGMDYPHVEWFQADDETRHLALLSKFPVVSRDSQSAIQLDIGGQVRPMARGILDVTVEPAPGYKLRLLGVHLKSKREVPEYDQSEMRLREAMALRSHAEEILDKNPDANLLIFGDLNDTKNEPPIKNLLGHPAAPHPLTALDIADNNGERWTHFWKYADIYSRIDYLVASRALLPEILKEQSGINSSPVWNKASDHRAIFTAISPVDK